MFHPRFFITVHMIIYIILKRGEIYNHKDALMKASMKGIPFLPPFEGNIFVAPIGHPAFAMEDEAWI